MLLYKAAKRLIDLKRVVLVWSMVVNVDENLAVHAFPAVD